MTREVGQLASLDICKGLLVCDPVCDDLHVWILVEDVFAGAQLLAVNTGQTEELADAVVLHIVVEELHGRVVVHPPCPGLFFVLDRVQREQAESERCQTSQQAARHPRLAHRVHPVGDPVHRPEDLASTELVSSTA